MNRIKYIFITMLIVNFPKIVAMMCEEIPHQLETVGKTANLSMAQKLLDNGMSVNAVGYNGQTMLIHAISYAHETKDNKIPAEPRLKFIEFLLQNGAELSPKTDNWQNIPMLTAYASKIGEKIISLFIRYGADINITHPSHGSTALHLAASNGRLGVVNFLLNQKNIKINAKDNEGRTPLICAVFWGYYKVVKALIEHGADRTIKDLSNRTAIDYANSEDKKNIKNKVRKLLLSNQSTMQLKKIGS